MKKFLFEIVLLFILVAISINHIDGLNRSPRVKYILDITENLDIVNFGTSHGQNFHYSGLNIHGKPINRGGNTLYYDLQNYKFIKNRLSDGAIILLPISYFAFGLDENRADNGVDNPFVNEFYEYLPRKSIYSYSEKRAISLKVNRIQKNFRNLFPKEVKKKKTPKKVAKKKESPTDTISHEQMLKDFAIKRVVHHKKIGTFTTPEKNVNYLKMLIADAKQAGFKPILVTVPYYREYTDRFGADWMAENYNQYMSQISSEYNIPYLDYRSDPRFSNTPELFANSDHLNKQGIAEFNIILREDLIKLGAISEDDLKQKKKK